MRTSVLASAAVATIAVAGAAAAAIPGSDGAVTACYERANPAKGNSNGPLRPVDSASDCSVDENAVTLGARGPQGPPGPPGNDGQTVSAEPPQVFENNFDGALPGGRFSSLPNSGDPFSIGVDVPAGTYLVLAQTNMAGVTATVRHFAFGSTRTYYGGVLVLCTLSAGGQSNDTSNWIQDNTTWTQNLTVTLSAPGGITMTCRTPKFDPTSSDDYQTAALLSQRLNATRLPQTRVTRTITLVAALSSLPHTTERRPPDPARLDTLEVAQERQQISAIARALHQTGH